MNYHATRGDGGASARRAEDALLRLSELSKDPSGGRGNVEMSMTSFNTVLKAWGNNINLHTHQNTIHTDIQYIFC